MLAYCINVDNIEDIKGMALLEWHWVLSTIVIFVIWLFCAVKKVHHQINKKNNRVPDIKILKKIIPPSSSHGWLVTSVCNAVPIWKYSTTFTFAPQNLVTTRTILQGKSSKILEELKNAQVFSMLFPDFPLFTCQETRSDNLVNSDILTLKDVFASLSLPSLLLTGQHTVLTFERYWFDGVNLTWLYVCPTVQLLASQYGYWICFFIQDMEYDNSSVLHIISSYPSDITAATINKRISSCQVLLKDHMDSLHQQGVKLIADSSDTDSLVKVKKKTQMFSSQSSIGSSNNKTSPAEEAYGCVEEPAVIECFPACISSVHKLLDSTHRHSKADVPNKKNIEKSPKKHTENSQKKSANIRPTSISSIPSQHTNVIVPQPAPAPVLDDIHHQTEVKVKVTQRKEKTVTENKKLVPYLDIIKEGYEMLMSSYEADESTPGWELFNDKDDVIVHKKAGTEDFPNDIYKGVTTIKVPLPYLLNYLLDLQYKTEFDAVFESGQNVEDLGDGITKVAYLAYKNIWPTTGRDFCSISAPRHIRDNLYGIFVKSVTHKSCLEKKSKVRGELILAGYIIEEASVDPPATNLTFLTCADFKGYIPGKIVNKVSSDQPLSVGIIRKRIQDRYKIKDPHTDGKEWLDKIHAVPSVYPQEEIIIESVTEAPVDLNTDVTCEEESNLDSVPADFSLSEVSEMNTFESSEDSNSPKVGIINMANESSTNNTPETICRNSKCKTKNPVMNGVDKTQSNFDQYGERNSPTINSFDNGTMLSSGFDLKENHYTYSQPAVQLQLPANEPHGGENSDNEDSGSQLSHVTEDESSSVYQSHSSIDDSVLTDFPRDSSGQIDFVTLGNQSAAALEEEFFIARKVSTEVKHDPAKQEQDLWKYQGTSKDVTIMRKISSRQKFHSFLGRGIINALPVTVWETIKTPSTRFVYDNMLKKISIVKELGDKSKIIHMRHETHACFVKQARDFCFMTVERVKQQRYVLVGASIDVPECPQTSDCIRGTIISSGWIIEPMVQNGKACSLVTYISQVNFGGRLPSRLVNFIAKRQPLAVAYLRNYLESAEI